MKRDFTYVDDIISGIYGAINFKMKKLHKIYNRKPNFGVEFYVEDEPSDMKIKHHIEDSVDIFGGMDVPFFVIGIFSFAHIPALCWK